MILAYKALMVLTFLAALTTLLSGVLNMGTRSNEARGKTSNRLMMLRVGLCILLLVEILIYSFLLV
jgi:hypothetical protein